MNVYVYVGLSLLLAGFGALVSWLFVFRPYLKMVREEKNEIINHLQSDIVRLEVEKGQLLDDANRVISEKNELVFIAIALRVMDYFAQDIRLEYLGRTFDELTRTVYLCFTPGTHPAAKNKAAARLGVIHEMLGRIKDEMNFEHQLKGKICIKEFTQESI